MENNVSRATAGAAGSASTIDHPVRLPERSGARDAALVASRAEVLAAQHALCASAVRLAATATMDPDPLGTLVALDAQVRPTVERLLACYVEGDDGLRTLDRQYFVAAARLCEAMVVAGEVVLQKLDAAGVHDRGAPATRLLVLLIVYRRFEYVLRMFRYKRRNANQWRALNDAYRRAADRGLHAQAVAVGAAASSVAQATTVEQEYVQALLLEVTNDGQLSPRELLWACEWIARWCRVLRLQARAAATRVESGFAVDLLAAEGPARKLLTDGARVMCLDVAPLAPMLDDALAVERAAAACTDDVAHLTVCARIALLERLAHLFAPVPPRIERRGERSPITATVEVGAGLILIFHMLRNASAHEAARAPGGIAAGDSTIGAFRGTMQPMTLAAMGSTAFAQGVTTEPWHMRDQSESGCRLRGKTSDINRILPGSLLAMRASDASPWSLTVVRRLRRLMVDRVELGVEYVGSRPRFVKVVLGAPGELSPARLAEGGTRCVGALYLPPSEARPVVPIRTLLLPARDVGWHRKVTLLASNAIYTLRMHEPIRREREFVVAPFTVVGRADATKSPAR